MCIHWTMKWWVRSDYLKGKRMFSHLFTGQFTVLPQTMPVAYFHLPFDFSSLNKRL